MEVKVYSTPSCPWCVRVKEYLTGLGVAYTNVDITTDRALAMELVKKTKQIGVPVTFIGDKFVVGFNEPELEALLKANGQTAGRPWAKGEGRKQNSVNCGGRGAGRPAVCLLYEKIYKTERGR